MQACRSVPRGWRGVLRQGDYPVCRRGVRLGTARSPDDRVRVPRLYVAKETYGGDCRAKDRVEADRRSQGMSPQFRGGLRSAPAYHGSPARLHLPQHGNDSPGDYSSAPLVRQSVTVGGKKKVSGEEKGVRTVPDTNGTDLRKPAATLGSLPKGGQGVFHEFSLCIS